MLKFFSNLFSLRRTKKREAINDSLVILGDMHKVAIELKNEALQQLIWKKVEELVKDL